MQQEFDKEIYGQRWQVETVFSMIKRNQGEALRARTYWAQNREMMLKILTHNIAIILIVNELFYRAGPVPFFGLPLGLNVDCNFKRAAVLSIQLVRPNGAPRFTLFSIRLN